MSATRIRAIFRQELREYRGNSSVVVAMSVIPVIFVITPLVQMLNLSASSASTLLHGAPLLNMLGIPALVPAVVAAVTVVGERQQGTLEPVLTTPIRREEFLIGKALAVLAPALTVSYAVFVLFLVAVEVFAQASVASAVVRGPVLKTAAAGRRVAPKLARDRRRWAAERPCELANATPAGAQNRDLLPL
jgi:ABC-type Na+ efflux pump permease subunit